MFVKKGNQMGLSYNRLRSLVKIAETGSVSAAAIDLNVSQPALSRALNDTERSLGVILFERRGRGVKLTEIGHRFCEHAREIIERYEMIQNNLSELDGQLTGTASVVFPESVGRMISVPLVRRMKEKHPLVTLRLMTALPDMIPHLLNSGRADVGVISNTSAMLGVHATPFITENLQLIGPANTVFPDAATISFAKVAQLPLILPATEGTRTIIDRIFHIKRLQPKITFEMDSPIAQLDLVRQGEGFAILAFSMAHRSINQGEFSAHTIVDPSIERVLSTALAGNRPQTSLYRVIEKEIIHLASEAKELARWVVSTPGTDPN